MIAGDDQPHALPLRRLLGHLLVRRHLRRRPGGVLARSGLVHDVSFLSPPVRFDAGIEPPTAGTIPQNSPPRTAFSTLAAFSLNFQLIPKLWRCRRAGPPAIPPSALSPPAGGAPSPRSGPQERDNAPNLSRS